VIAVVVAEIVAAIGVESLVPRLAVGDPFRQRRLAVGLA
jgi:hypothetical protein